MKDTLHSTKLLHYWSFNIRLFSVISRTLIGGVLPLYRGAVSVFYSQSWLGHRIFVGEVLPLYRDTVSVFYSFSWLDHKTFVGEVLLFCRDAIGVFYSLRQLGHRTLEGVLPLCRDAPVYSIALRQSTEPYTGRPKTVHYAIEVNLTSSTSVLSASSASHSLGKSFWCYRIVSYVTKILQNFRFTLVT